MAFQTFFKGTPQVIERQAKRKQKLANEKTAKQLVRLRDKKRWPMALAPCC